MSANVNSYTLHNFVKNLLPSGGLTREEAKKYDIDSAKFDELNKDENYYLDDEELLDDDEMYAMFATMYVEERDKDSAAVDEEKQKQEALKIQDKGGSKA